MTVTAPPGAVLPPPTATQPRPSTRGYWLGGILTAAAVVGAAIWLVVTFFEYQQQIDRYPRLTVPGVATVQVADTSARVLFYENTRGATTPTYSQLVVTVTDSAGAPVTVSPYGGDLRYDVPGDNSRVGHAVAEFHPTQPGSYQVRSAATDVTGTLAVGDDFVWDIAPHAIGAGLLFLVGGVAGITLLVVTGVRRANTRR
jgi:hypothetical protein